MVANTTEIEKRLWEAADQLRVPSLITEVMTAIHY